MTSTAAEIAIRVPSTAALFDAWSVEPLAGRPLSDEAERIVNAVRADLTATKIDARRHWIRRAWVALWGPAYRLLTAASFRRGRRYFAELAEAEIAVRWD